MRRLSPGFLPRKCRDGQVERSIQERNPGRDEQLSRPSAGAIFGKGLPSALKAAAMLDQAKFLDVSTSTAADGSMQSRDLVTATASRIFGSISNTERCRRPLTNTAGWIEVRPKVGCEESFGPKSCLGEGWLGKLWQLTLSSLLAGLAWFSWMWGVDSP